MADPLIDEFPAPEGTNDVPQAVPRPAKERGLEAREERRRVQGIQAASLVILAVAAVLSLMYIAKLILVVVLTSVLLSFVLAPVVDALADLRIPRPAGAFFAVALLVASIAIVSYVSYARALDFMSEVPEYRIRLQHIVNEIRMQAERLEKTTETVLPPEPEDKNTVTIREPGGLGNFIGHNMSTFSETFLAVSFIPFLVYFMLSWQDHVRASSVMLFQMKNRNTAYVTLGLIAAMIRSFIVGNFIIGLFLSAASIAAFGLMGLPYFYFLGVISGFLSLIPYLGVVLAILPPVIVGLGYLTTATFILTCALVVGLHLFAMNVLYPMVLGKRLRLNPLAVTLALLFWGWLWGAMGLILAVPVTGALKIICDNIDRLRPFGAWMGE
ncbi:MAG TPA: AI-2E family transporter [Candidatus Bathyarchaeia archaeon]|nr:AI-2E family transporter [Candidatus Bathyarchaeia archaeon]